MQLKNFLLLVLGCCLLSQQAFAVDDKQQGDREKSVVELMRFDPAMFAPENLSEADVNMPAAQYLRLQYEQFDLQSLTVKLENALYNLHYYQQTPTGKMNPELKKAIKNFQKDMDKPATGELTVAQLYQLIGRYQQAFPGGIHGREIYPEKLKVQITNNIVAAQGTWLALNREQQYTSIESSEIRCNRRDNRCVEAMAMIVDGSTQMAGYDRLTVGSMVWEITSWDSGEIVAENTLNPCVSYSLFIEPETKKVYLQYRYKGAQNCSHAEGEAPTINQLVDGPTFAKKYYNQKERRQDNVYNPRYVERLRMLQDLQ